MKDKTDVILGVILAITGIIFLIGGWRVILFTAKKIEEIGYAAKLYAIPGGLMIIIGGGSLMLLIELVYINLTGKKPWWTKI